MNSFRLGKYKCMLFIHWTTEVEIDAGLFFWVFFFVILFVCLLYVSADMCYSACVESRRPLSAVNSTVVSTLNLGHQIVQC